MKTLLLLPLVLLQLCHATPFNEENSCDMVADGAICLFEGRKLILPDATPKGLVAHWDFDGNVVVDSSGNRNHGKNPIPVGPGIWGRGASAYFNGFDYVEFDHSASLQEAGKVYSMTMWIFLIQEVPSRGASRWCPLVHKGADGAQGSPSLMMQTESRKLQFSSLQSGLAAKAAEAETTARLPLQRWAHVAMVRSEEKLEIYVNGVLDSTTSAGNPGGNEKSLYLGGVPWLHDECNIPVYMDEVRYYSRALTGYEVVAEAAPALGGLSPTALQLGCQSCAVTKAKTSCPKDFHVCTSLELHAGGYQFASVMGYVDAHTLVWAHADLAGTSTEMGTAICCTDKV